MEVEFREYRFGSKFEVLANNNPFTYVQTTAKLDGTGQRWVASLCDYDYVIKYRRGRKNIDADRLSRCPEPDKENIILPNVIKALSFSLGVESCQLVESVALSDSQASIPPLLQPEISDQLLQAYGLTSMDWRSAQKVTKRC